MKQQDPTSERKATIQVSFAGMDNKIVAKECAYFRLRIGMIVEKHMIILKLFLKDGSILPCTCTICCHQ